MEKECYLHTKKYLPARISWKNSYVFKDILKKMCGILFRMLRICLKLFYIFFYIQST